MSKFSYTIKKGFRQIKVMVKDEDNRTVTFFGRPKDGVYLFQSGEGNLVRPDNVWADELTDYMRYLEYVAPEISEKTGKKIKVARFPWG